MATWPVGVLWDLLSSVATVDFDGFCSSFLKILIPCQLKGFKHYSFLFQLCVHTWVGIWVCVHACRCLWSPRCSGFPETGVTDGCEQPDVSVGNWILVLSKSSHCFKPQRHLSYLPKCSDSFILFFKKVNSDPFACMCVCALYPWRPKEGIRSHRIRVSRWLEATIWVLGIEPRFLLRVASALNHWPVSSAPNDLILNWDLFLTYWDWEHIPRFTMEFSGKKLFHMQIFYLNTTFS